MNIDLSRRGFLKLAGAGVAATSLGALGFGEAEAAELAHVRAFKLAASFASCRKYLALRQPDVVLGMGGYVTVPGGMMARARGIPLALVNADAALLLSNKTLTPMAQRVLFGFPADFGKAAGNVTTPLSQRPTSIKTLEWERIHQTLAETGFNVSESARRLGLHRRTLARKLEKRQVE